MTFSDDGTFRLVGGELGEQIGSFFFTSENSIAYSLPSSQGMILIEFVDDDHLHLTITRSSDVFGLLVSADRIK